MVHYFPGKWFEVASEYTGKMLFLQLEHDLPLRKNAFTRPSGKWSIYFRKMVNLFQENGPFNSGNGPFIGRKMVHLILGNGPFISGKLSIYFRKMVHLF